MKKSILATIYYTVDSEHPDIQYIKNPSEIQSFTDVYRFHNVTFEFSTNQNDIDKFNAELKARFA